MSRYDEMVRCYTFVVAKMTESESKRVYLASYTLARAADMLIQDRGTDSKKSHGIVKFCVTSCMEWSGPNTKTHTSI